MLEKFLAGCVEDPAKFSRNKSLGVSAREGSSYFLSFNMWSFSISLNLLHQASYKHVRLVTSAILGMTFCSMTTESWASTRMRPAWIFSLGFPSIKPSVSFDELVFPESTRKWDSSDLKKSWNPFWIQPMSKSFILTNIPVFSSRSWRNSWDDIKHKRFWEWSLDRGNDSQI